MLSSGLGSYLSSELLYDFGIKVFKVSRETLFTSIKYNLIGFFSHDVYFSPFFSVIPV